MPGRRSRDRGTRCLKENCIGRCRRLWRKAEGVFMKICRRVASVLVVLLLTGGLAQAQYESERKHKHWYTDRKWWVGEAAIAGIRAADGHTHGTRTIQVSALYRNESHPRQAPSERAHYRHEQPWFRHRDWASHC